jgi:hypothetical protein
MLPFQSATVVTKFKVQLWLLDAVFQIVDAFFPRKSIETVRLAAGTSGSAPAQNQPEIEEGQQLDFRVEDTSASASGSSGRPNGAVAAADEAPLGAITCEQLFFALDLLSSSLNFSRAFNSNVMLRRKLYAAGFITEHTLQGRLPQLFLQETRATRLVMHLLFRMVREGSAGESVESESQDSMNGAAWMRHQEQQANASGDEDIAPGSLASNGGATPSLPSFSAYVHLSELRILTLSLRFLHDYVAKSVSGQMVSLEFSEELLCSFVENVARLSQASPARFKNYLSVWFHPLVQLIAFATPPIRAHLALLLQHALPPLLPIPPIVPFPLHKIQAPAVLVPAVAVPNPVPTVPTPTSTPAPAAPAAGGD